MSDFALETELRKKYKDQLDHLDIFPPRHGGFELKLIEVKKELRGSGIGTKVMHDICNYADSHGLIIVLSPSEIKTNKLVKWYKEFDFHENKGRNKDFRFMNRMIRYPLGLTRSKWIDAFPNAEAEIAKAATTWPTGDNISGSKIKEYLEHGDNDINWNNFGIEDSIWELKDVKISDIKPFKLESREDEETAVEYSKLKTEIPPIVIDSDGNILDGHHRVRAAIIGKKTTVKAFVPMKTSTASSENLKAIYRHNSIIMYDSNKLSEQDEDGEPSISSAIVGVIDLRFNNKFKCYEIEALCANRGRGMELIEIATSAIYPNSLITDRTNRITPSAEKLFNRMLNNEYFSITNINSEDNLFPFSNKKFQAQDGSLYNKLKENLNNELETLIIEEGGALLRIKMQQIYASTATNKRLKYIFIFKDWKVTYCQGSSGYTVYNKDKWMTVYNSLRGAQQYIAKKLGIKYQDIEFKKETEVIASMTTASDYLVREDSMPDKYLVSKWEDKNEPSSSYVVFKDNKGELKCNCPVSYKGPCKHTDIVKTWIKMKKPEGKVIEASTDVNWVWPTKADFDNEWKTEDLLSFFSYAYESEEKQNVWKDLLYSNLKNISEVKTITKEMLNPRNPDYYQADSIEDLKEKVSYMKKDVDSTLKQFESNGSLFMPLLIEDKGVIKTLGGRTRLSIAFILNKLIKGIVINKEKLDEQVIAPLKRKSFLENNCFFIDEKESKQAVLDYVDGKISIDDLKNFPELKNINDKELGYLIDMTCLKIKKPKMSKAQPLYENIPKYGTIAEFAPSGYCKKCKKGGWDGSECSCSTTAAVDLIDIVTKYLDIFNTEVKKIGIENPEDISSKVMKIAETQQILNVGVSPKKIIYEKTKADIGKIRIKNVSNDKEKFRLNNVCKSLEKNRLKNAYKNFLKIFLRDFIKELGEFQKSNKWVNVKEIVEPFNIDWSGLDIVVSSIKFTEKSEKGNIMKSLLAKHGIKIENNKISKADLDKAIEVLACNMSELMLEGKKLDEEFAKLFNSEACNMSDLLIEGKELETKKLDKLLVGGKKDKTMKGLTDTKEVLEDELSKIYDNSTKQKIEEKIEDLIVDNKSLKEKDFYEAKAATLDGSKIRSESFGGGIEVYVSNELDSNNMMIGLNGFSSGTIDYISDIKYSGALSIKELKSNTVSKIKSIVDEADSKIISLLKDAGYVKGTSEAKIAKAELHLTRNQIGELRKRIIDVKDEMDNILSEFDDADDGFIVDLIERISKDVKMLYQNFNADSKDINVIE